MEQMSLSVKEGSAGISDKVITVFDKVLNGSIGSVEPFEGLTSCLKSSLIFCLQRATAA